MSHPLEFPAPDYTHIYFGGIKFCGLILRRSWALAFSIPLACNTATPRATSWRASPTACFSPFSFVLGDANRCEGRGSRTLITLSSVPVRIAGRVSNHSAHAYLRGIAHVPQASSAPTAPASVHATSGAQPTG